MLIGGEEHPVAIAATVGRISQCAEAEKVGRSVEGEAVRRSEPLACQNLLGDRLERGVLEAGAIELAGHRISFGGRG